VSRRPGVRVGPSRRGVRGLKVPHPSGDGCSRSRSRSRASTQRECAARTRPECAKTRQSPVGSRSRSRLPPREWQTRQPPPASRVVARFRGQRGHRSVLRKRARQTPKGENVRCSAQTPADHPTGSAVVRSAPVASSRLRPAPATPGSAPATLGSAPGAPVAAPSSDVSAGRSRGG